MTKLTPPKRALIWAAVSTRPQADEDEKFSIPQQIADAEALCKENGWQVVDVLKVPGHSRSYRTLDDLAEHARQQNIDAFDRLIGHFKACDFDVFICRDANRFARKSSLLHYIVETIIEDCGANIYSMGDAFWVDTSNVDMWATMQGYKVRAEIKWLVDAREKGLRRRAARGLTVSRRPWSHILLKDERGKPLRLVVDESKRRLFNDLFTLVVDERLAVNQLEKVLYERFGHVDATGRPYGNNVMYKFLYSPTTWGHIAYGHNRRKGSRRFEAWTFDETEDAPEGVEMYRNVTQAVYTGRQAELLKAELHRRKQVQGKRSAQRGSAYSGLFTCAMCGYSMAVVTKPGDNGERIPDHLWCIQGYVKQNYIPHCTQTSTTPIEGIHDYLDKLLRKLVATQDLSLVMPDFKDVTADITAVKQEAADLSEQLDNLILLQSKAPVSTQAAYQKRINAAGEQLAILEVRLRELTSSSRRQASQEARARSALADIGADVDGFWRKDPAEINQLLHRLIGRNRFYVLEKKIIGIRPAPARKRRKTAAR